MHIVNSNPLRRIIFQIYKQKQKHAATLRDLCMAIEVLVIKAKKLKHFKIRMKNIVIHFFIILFTNNECIWHCALEDL